MNIKKIVIVGGGSAGWMTAATLISQFPKVEISVIESPDVPTVGVGESTIGGINDWANMIGLDRDDFMKFTDASYKMSIRFTDFYKKDAGSFHYPFGHINLENNFAQKNDWLFKKALYPSTPTSDYAECMYPNMAMVMENKIDKNEDGRIPGFNFDRDTAFHFDATKFGLFLRDKFSKPKGVTHIQAIVKEIKTNEEGIDYLVLDNDEHIKADLFIDCTGFKSLLLAESLNEPFTSFSDMLPNNSAWATQVPYTNKQEQLVSYTDCHAIQNGWVWNIPLWSRIGTGYVYSDKFVSDEQALEEFKEHLKEKGIYSEDAKYKNIKMRIGVHERIWVKNVAAIGLSAGFIEPLESNGLYSVHEFLIRMVRTLGRNQTDAEIKVSQWDIDNYNYQCIRLFKSYRDFVGLHYAASHRDDTPYWVANMNRVYSKDMANVKYTPDLDLYMEQSNQRFRAFHYDWNNNGGLHCIMTGMNCFSSDKQSFIAYDYSNGVQDENMRRAVKNLSDKKSYWKSLIKDSPTLHDYLEKTYYS
jgi:tryptophan halogenase